MGNLIKHATRLRNTWQQFRDLLSGRPLAAMQEELQRCQERIKGLEAELFNVPELPSTRWLDQPLEDRLADARGEVDQFIDGITDISDDEYRYLMLQTFFRGPCELITDQLSVVIESIETDGLSTELPVVDIGCGRGELLQVLEDRGFNALGIDTSALMVDKLKEQDLQAIRGDAIEQLEKFQDNALCGVTAFHMVEHVQPDYLREMLSTAFRKISPGGFILIETPNPFCFESLSFFHTDATHIRPIQPFQLAFLTEYAGFSNSRAHFSAPVPATRKGALSTWIRLYQNHGIVAYKPKVEAQFRAAAA